MLNRFVVVSVVSFILLIACNPIAPSPTPTPLSTSTLAPPTAVPTPTATTFALDTALLPEYKNDLARLDHPTTFDLDLHLDPASAILTGSERVNYTNHDTTSLDAIYFRLFANYPNAGGGISLNAARVNGELAGTTRDAHDTALRVALPQALAPQQSTNIALDFRVTIPISVSERYNEFGHADGIFTFPSIYPLIPARDNGNWHLDVGPPYGDLVYADASSYDVRITAPATMAVIASGSTVATQTNAEGTNTWHIIAAPARDFSFVASDRLKRFSTRAGDAQVNSYFLDKDNSDGVQVAQWAAKALEVYSQRLGAYPYREFDVVETPTTAGGIEYPGMVVIASNLYSAPRSRDFFQFAVVHETAHQWFYGVVGDDQVNHPWLDESLVQYCTLIYYEDTYDKTAADRIRREYFQGLYQSAKKNNRDQVIGLPVNEYDEQQYSQIVYGKGPLFFDALRQELGDELFFKWLHAYFEKYKYKNVSPSEFLQTLNEVSGKDFSALFEEWVGK